MNRDQMIAAIRQKCIPANPDSFGGGYDDRLIRLSDVLLAIRKFDSDSMAEKVAGDLVFLVDKGWKLEKDDLTEQSEECVSFLYSLLSPSPASPS